MPDDNHNNMTYKHKSATECQAFLTKLRSKSRSKGADVFTVFKHAINNTAHGLNAGDYGTANAELYDLITINVSSETLLATLGSVSNIDNGVSSIKYIKGCWSSGGNENKESVAAEEYTDSLNAKPGITAEELRIKFNDHERLRNDLLGTDREISNEKYCADIKDMVSKLSHEHKLEVKDGMRSLDVAVRKNPGEVQQMLEGVVAGIALDRSKEDKESARRVLSAEQPRGGGVHNVTDEQLAALIARGVAAVNSGSKSTIAPCDACGVRHPDGAKGCHALCYSKGETVPGWDAKPDDQKERIKSRAADITRLGLYKDRQRGGGGGHGGGGGGNAGKALMSLLATLQTGASFVVSPVTMSRVHAVRETHGVAAIGERLIIDTGNLSGKHLISNRSLFTNLDETAPSLPICVANEAIEYTKGDGPVDVVVVDGSGKPVGRMTLRDCSYAPSLGVNLICVKQLKHRGASVDLDSHDVRFGNGVVIPFDDDFSMRIIPTPNGVYPAIIARGKDGPTHIDNGALTAAQLREIDLWSARLNDQTAETLRSLPDIVHGAPAVLKLATKHQTLTHSRLMADGRKMPTVERSEPISKKPGERTSFDHWSAPCTGVLGSNGIIAGIDNASGHFRLFPVASKAEAPECADRYYREAARDGVKVETGSVYYSDNEKIFQSKRLFDILDKHGLVHEFSAEYEPWGNGGIESVFRYCVEGMSRAHIRGGAPDDFWEFSALDQESLLNTVRSRGGKTVRELWRGRRGNVSRRRVLFCKITARMPIPWRGGKISARSIDGVYCGKARNKQGVYIWSEKYGLCTSSSYTCIESEFPFKDGTVVYKPRPRGSGGGGGGGGVPAAVYHDSDDEGDDSDGSSPGGDAPGGSNDDSDDDSDDSGVVHYSPKKPTGPKPSTDDSSERSDPDSDSPSESSHSSSSSPQPGAQPTRHSTRLDGSVALDETVYNNDVVPTSKKRAANVIANRKWCAQVAKHMLLTGVIPSRTPNAKVCSSTPVTDDYVPGPRANIDDIPDDIVRDLWKASDRKEIDGILKWAKVTKVKDMPKFEKVVGSTTQRKIKRDGTYKSRVCAQGFSQIFGQHYDRKQSPCIAHSSLRSLIAIAACENAELCFVDFTQAYTQSDLDPSEYIYMRPPPGHTLDEDGDEVVWLITRSLYGMKQAGRNWYFRLRQWLVDYGFAPSTADPCVFHMKTAVGFITLGLYVDDMVIAHTDAEARDLFVSKMKADFDFTDQGQLTDVLGLQVSQDTDSITITHENYINKLAETFLKGEANRKEHKTPASMDLDDLVTAACDSKSEVDPTLMSEYRSLVGSLLFCSTTVRPDISYAVGMLSRALNKPSPRLLDEAKRVLYYLVQTAKLGLRYMRGVPIRLFGMTDSSWATRRSTSGFAFFLAGAAISYLSKKQPTIALSSTEAEIMAASLGALEAIYLSMLLSDMGIEITDPIDVFVDNKGAIDLSYDYMANERTKHIARRHFKIRELVQEAAIRVKYVASSDNIADIFTKPLDKKQFLFLRAKLLNLPR